MSKQSAEHDLTDQNPARGFYHVYTYDIAGEENEEDWVWSLQKDERLALLILDIGKCAGRDQLTEAELDKITRIFRFFKEHEKQMIVRFTYDTEGKGAEHEPESFYWIMGQILQVMMPVLDFSSHIFIVQGLFIGSWGEMHNSNFLHPNDLGLLYGAVGLAADRCGVYTSVRTPWQKRLLERMSKKWGWKRIGLYDDAIFGSETDMGTFGSACPEDEESGPLPLEQELAYVEEQTKWAPCGGEVLARALELSPKEVLERMRLMHLTYLNSVHEQAVWEKWKTVSCAEAGVEDADASVSFYDYIRTHLGYRYVLEDIRLTQPEDEKGDCLEIVINNTGFACCHNSLRLELTLGEQKQTVSFMENECLKDGKICVILNIGKMARAQADETALAVNLALYHEKTGLPVYFANDFSDKWDTYCSISSCAEGVTVGVLSSEKDASS